MTRPGEPGDAAAVAQIWWDGWRLGHVADGIACAFYERLGWRDEGELDDEAAVEDGSTVTVPCAAT